MTAPYRQAKRHETAAPDVRAQRRAALTALHTLSLDDAALLLDVLSLRDWELRPNPNLSGT